MLNVNLNVWGEYIVFNILLGYTWAKNSEAHWTMYGICTQWDTMQLFKKMRQLSVNWYEKILQTYCWVKSVRHRTIQLVLTCFWQERGEISMDSDLFIFAKNKTLKIHKKLTLMVTCGERSKQTNKDLMKTFLYCINFWTMWIVILWGFFKSSQEKERIDKITKTWTMLKDTLGDKYLPHCNNISYKALVSLSYKERLKKH